MTDTKAIDMICEGFQIDVVDILAALLRFEEGCEATSSGSDLSQEENTCLWPMFDKNSPAPPPNIDAIDLS